MRRFAIPAVVLTALSCNECLAALVRFDIAGTLTNVSSTLPNLIALPPIGSQFSGSYVVDTSAADSNPAVDLAAYSTPFPNGTTRLQVGALKWRETGESPVTVIVGNNLPNNTDIYSVGNSRIEVTPPDPTAPPGAEYWLFRWDLEGPTTALSSTTLPQAAFPLAPWTSNRWSISLWGTPPAPLLEMSGPVTSFSSVVVPEPASAILAGIGLLSLGVVASRCKRTH